MATIHSINKVKGIFYFTSILDPYLSGTIEEFCSHDILPGIKTKVYIIHHDLQNYVLKTLSCPKKATEVINNARNECILLQKLSKENKYIVNIIDKQEYENPKNDVMNIEILLEYGGKSLDNYIGKFGASNLMVLIRKTTSAFALLEKNKVFHSDIKPQNIVYKDGEIKIIDFGISRELKEKTLLYQIITSFGTKYIGGTYQYLPPEILNRSKNYILSKIDVYCWGMTMYQLAAKKTTSDLNEEIEKYKLFGKNYDEFIESLDKIQLDDDINGYFSGFFIQILKSVLDFNPEKRPTFVMLKNSFGAEFCDSEKGMLAEIYGSSEELNIPQKSLNHSEIKISLEDEEKKALILTVSDLKKEYEKLANEKKKIEGQLSDIYKEENEILNENIKLKNELIKHPQINSRPAINISFNQEKPARVHGELKSIPKMENKTFDLNNPKIKADNILSKTEILAPDNQKLKTEIKKIQLEKEKLIMDNHRLKSELEKLLKKKPNQQNIKLINEEVKELKNSLKIAQEENKTAILSKKKLDTELINLKNANSVANKNLKLLNEKFIILNNELKSEKEEHEKTKEGKQKVENELQIVLDENSDQNTNIKILNEEIIKIRNELNSEKMQKDQAFSDKQKIEIILNQCRKDNMSMNSKFQSEISQLKSEIVSLKAEKAKYQCEFSKYESASKSYQVQLAAAQNAISEISKDRARQQTDYEAQIVKLRAEIKNVKHSDKKPAVKKWGKFLNNNVTQFQQQQIIGGYGGGFQQQQQIGGGFQQQQQIIYYGGYGGGHFGCHDDSADSEDQ